MKILVTGATGFIGRHVIDCLLGMKKEEIEIIATSMNFEKARDMPWYKDVRYIPCDLYRKDDFYSIFERPGYLIHLAWKGLPNFNANFHFDENMVWDYHFLKNMIDGGIKRFIVTGTCLEYGMQSGCLSENQETKPCTGYGRAKDNLRKMLEYLLKGYSDVSFCWARLFYMFGKGQSDKSFVSLLKKAIENDDAVFNMSGGKQVRDFLAVELIADYIVKLVLNMEAYGVYNVCSGTPMSLKKMAKKIIQQEKSDISLNLGYYPYPEYEPMEFWGDAAKLKSATT